MAWVAYGAFLKKLCNLADTIDLDDNSTTTVKCALLTSAYTADTNADTGHDFWNDLSANEVSGTGYTAGGNAVTNRTVTASGATITFDGNDPATWSQNASGFNNARYAVLYKDTGSAATSPLICYADLGANKGNTGGDLTIQFSGTSGIFTLS